MHRAEFSELPGGLRTQKADVFSHVFNIALDDFKNGKMDNPLQPNGLTGIFYLKSPIKRERLIEKVMGFVPKVFRLHAVPKLDKSRGNWTYFDEIPIDQIDRAYHFVEVGEVLDEKEWNEMLTKYAQVSFDQDKPHWKMINIKKLPDGRSCLLFLTNHAVGDGTSLTTLLRTYLCDATKEIKPLKKRAGVQKHRHVSFAERAAIFINGIVTPLVEAVLPSDRDTKLKVPAGALVNEWDFCLSPDHLPVEMFKEIKDRVPGATVNDVILTVTALAIKNYYTKIEESIMKSKDDLRTTFVVNTRPREADPSTDKWFGNDLIVTSVTYPLHCSRVETLLRIRRETIALKSSPEVYMRKLVRDKLLSSLPPHVIAKAAVDLNCKFSFTVSNVFISEVPLSIAGAEVDDLSFVALTPFGAYLGISSYDGKVRFNSVFAKCVNADSSLLNPEFAKELKCLHKEVMAMDEKDMKALEQVTPGTELTWPSVCALALVTTVLYHVLF